MKEMEAEIAGLQREKDDLNNALATAKASVNSSKLVHRSVYYCARQFTARICLISHVGKRALVIALLCYGALEIVVVLLQGR